MPCHHNRLWYQINALIFTKILKVSSNRNTFLGVNSYFYYCFCYRCFCCSHALRVSTKYVSNKFEESIYFCSNITQILDFIHLKKQQQKWDTLLPANGLRLSLSKPEEKPQVQHSVSNVTQKSLKHKAGQTNGRTDWHTTNVTSHFL